MNVMKAAHKYARHLISISPNLTYRSALKASLIRAHKEYKAMAKKELTDTQFMIAQTEKFIKDIQEFLPKAAGYIVTTGQLRVCVNAEIGVLTHLLSTPNYDSVADARFYAARVRNGAGEGGQVELWKDRLNWEIEEQNKLIEALKNC